MRQAEPMSSIVQYDIYDTDRCQYGSTRLSFLGLYEWETVYLTNYPCSLYFPLLRNAGMQFAFVIFNKGQRIYLC